MTIQNANVLRLRWDGLAGTSLEATAISVLTEGTFSDVAARVSCVAIADGYVYFLIDELISSDDTQYELSRYPIEPWLLDVPNNLRDDIQVLEMGSDGNIDGDANGLSVCGSACQADCETTCECTTDCGFCFDDAGGDTCQCENSAAPNCTYTDTHCRRMCVAIPRIDACCLVKNPLALRRSGGDVCVVGVTTEEGTIDVGRAAPTGRWLKLPIHTVKSNAVTSPYYEGFSAAVPPQSRGRRFGFYRAHFDPDNDSLLEEWIPCIATENSGFVNTLYTYTISPDQSVSLGSEFLKDGLDRFEPTLRWRCTTFDTMGNPNDPVPVPSCDGSLVCPLSGSGLSDSIYEVYRTGREKRTWHPLFYLCVRSCNHGWFGADCALECGDCVNGVCDDVNGLCNCYPGFTGDTCEDVCPEGEIGKGCSYECSDVFPGSDCSNILICNPGKVGCKCYPGLQAPDCIKPCDAGYWGSNCQSTCTDPCDPRTGMPM
ncbi:putative angiopoietin-1 receptor [Apostichopus japonicus]|uniref:Putative angiopoietin-1 receptor n=1 Tax=Stichopus japonicus TaxID=307972 RepID=A0A2G8KPB0_STIJA|nr:putative angiopoietin-1 receptor [Apostichopus japonicus]